MTTTLMFLAPQAQGQFAEQQQRILISIDTRSTSPLPLGTTKRVAAQRLAFLLTGIENDARCSARGI
jgi:hypothetical protein